MIATNRARQQARVRQRTRRYRHLPPASDQLKIDLSFSLPPPPPASQPPVPWNQCPLLNVAINFTTSNASASLTVPVTPELIAWTAVWVGVGVLVNEVIRQEGTAGRKNDAPRNTRRKR